MAKTADQISQELAESINETDNTIDVSRGPIPALYIRPQSGQLAEVATEAENLRQLFTLQFSEVITDEEASLALQNYASAPGTGSRSKHVQYFMRFTKPVDDITITAGNLVSNIDGSLVYRTLDTVVMKASAANTYYNPSRNSYEVSVTVEALGTGDEYELTSLRVNTLLTPIMGIDATENRARSRGGTESETIEQQSARLKTSLNGTNYGAPGGISTRLRNAYPDMISDVSVIQPFDKEFTRMMSGSAIDVYMIGDQPSTFTQTYTASAGDKQIPLDRVPATGINRVTVNGIGSTATLVKDTSPESGYSINASDYAYFTEALVSGDEVVIEYNYNALLETVWNGYFGETESSLFNVDILVRSPFPVSPKISMNARILPSYDASTIELQLTEYLTTYFTPTTFQSVVYPEVIKQDIMSSIPGIQSLTITTFKRNTGALSEVEPIYLNRNENLVYDNTLVNLKVV